VPKVISGTVFIDGNNNGNVDSGEKPLAGVQINLTGTDFTGAAVNISTLTDLNGNYSFGGTTLLKPPQVGTHYTITEVQPAFLLNGIDKNSLNSPLVTDANPLDNLFTIAYAVTDQATLIGGLTFGERGIDIGSLTDASGFINDYMSKSGPNGFVIDASISGASAWSYSLPGWQNAKTMSVTLDTSLAFITITGTDGQNNPFSVVLHQQVSQNVGFPAGSLARFYILGTGANGQYILRIDGGPADMGLNLLAATSTSAGGEGEAPAGQYAQGADAVFAEGNWA